MYKVFMNDKPIILTDSFKKENNYEIIDFEETNLQKVCEILVNSAVTGVVLLSNNLSEAWKSFKKQVKLIKGAGGKVKNNNGDILFIHRFSKWDLPKGHIEKGEDKKTAAIREVEEECGITGLTIEKKLETTYHLFYYKEELRLKVTYWFLMNTTYEGKLIPQLEEGITEVVFKNPTETHEALKNTYQNIKLLF